MAYANAFGVDPGSVNKEMRSGGKVQELACQFGGGQNAVQRMAAGLGMALSDERATELAKGFRDANPRIVAGWYEIGDAAVHAVGSPGMVVPCLSGRAAYCVSNGFLFCRLPSLRVLAYAAPRLVETEDKFGRKRWTVEVDGVNSLTKKWGPQRLWGGLQFENIVQASARDTMAEAMFRLEERGYSLVLTVHDELLCEVPKDFGSVDEFKKIMEDRPSWARDLPTAVSAWRDVRYVK
jgi:DNA polymerase